MGEEGCGFLTITHVCAVSIAHWVIMWAFWFAYLLSSSAPQRLRWRRRGGVKDSSFSSGILCGGQQAGRVQRSSFSLDGEECFFVPRKLFALRLSMAHCFSELLDNTPHSLLFYMLMTFFFASRSAAKDRVSRT